jgi:hypothetical protein
MQSDRTFVYLLVPERKGDTYTTRIKRAVIRSGAAGREDLVEIAKLVQEKG